LVLVVFSLVPVGVLGAEFYFDGLPPVVSAGDQFPMFFRIDTKGETLNALGGSIKFASNLKVLGLLDGQSVVGVWNERPKLPIKANSNLSFSGILPGGYDGEDGLIFALNMEAGESGRTEVSLENVVAFENDGLATPATTTVRSLSFEIKPRSGSSTLIESSDREPPESFQPLIAREESIFDGRYFLVFQAVDKQSGLDHYEVAEVRMAGRWSNLSPNWEDAESPYELNDQALTSDIYVRAVDRSGNFIVIKVPARFPTPSSELPLWLGLWVVVLFLFVLLLLYAVWRIYIFLTRR
jgi:hypothetical protein